jgi:hypothetical protein
VWNRVLTVFRAGFAAHWGAGKWPAAPIVAHGTAAAVLCGLASGSLPPFAYGLFALAVSGALIALPLLGDFGPLLRSDPAAEWVEALPVTRGELRLARTLLVLFAVFVLSLASLLPAAWFAPPGLAGKIALVGAGLGQAILVAALLLALQSTLGERAETLLVLLQTVLVVGVVLGLAVGLRSCRGSLGSRRPSIPGSASCRRRGSRPCSPPTHFRGPGEPRPGSPRRARSSSSRCALCRSRRARARPADGSRRSSRLFGRSRRAPGSAATSARRSTSSTTRCRSSANSCSGPTR